MITLVDLVSYVPALYVSLHVFVRHSFMKMCMCVYVNFGVNDQQVRLYVNMRMCVQQRQRVSFKMCMCVIVLHACVCRVHVCFVEMHVCVYM